ncbi:MAG TPA: AAA family ATPase [Mycobacteriales bacterium]|jgi:cytidyltransferase-related domain
MTTEAQTPATGQPDTPTTATAGTLGVVIGKFLPPHRGHSLLIDTARAGCDHLLVIVCARDTDPIPASARADMLREIHPGVSVMVTPDDIADHDAECRAEQISGAWAERTRRLCLAGFGRRPEVVFTSEEYGPRYARILGARHVSVDPGRVRVPISGTMVRANPWSAWDQLHPCVRAWYTIRVCVVGAESTGTTTLARDLAARYDCDWVPEYGRTFCEERLAAGQRIDWRTEDFVHIARRQQANEDAAARAGGWLLICDTDALATSIWHQRYLGTRSAEVAAIAMSRRYALYLLTGDDIPFVQDGTRDGEHVRGWMTQRFREELAARALPWVEVTGSRARRLASATAHVDALLASGPTAR